jgi:hypothetical protein
VRIYGAVGPGTSTADKSGYSIAIYTQYLQITNDSMNPSDPNDSWDKVWGPFTDSGMQADGSRDALVKLRCRVIDSIGPTPSAFFTLPCELRLHKGAAEQPHRVELTMFMPDPKNNYVIKAKAREPQGTVFFTY